MSKSIKVADGLEVPINTTTVLIAAVILVPLAAQFLGILGDLVAPAPAPICYDSKRLSRPFPLKPVPMDSQIEKEALGGHIPELREKALDAQRMCQPGSCTPAQAKAYTGAVNSYLAYRMSTMARVERNYGEAGLEVARQTFASPEDKNIENGLIVRYASGDYQYNPRLTDMRQAIPLLTDPTRGRRYFEPCPSLRPEPGQS